MSIGTLLALWDTTGSLPDWAPAAESLARRHGAHVVLLACGVEPGLAAFGYADSAGAALAVQAEQAQAETDGMQAAAEAWLSETGLPGEVRASAVAIDALAERVGHAARAADLVIAPAPSASPREAVTVRAIEGALFDGGAPVLVCPSGARLQRVGTVTLGWDGGLESSRALRAALPLIAGSTSIEVVVIDAEPGPFPDGDPGAAATAMLARHGLHARLVDLESGDRSIAETLLARAEEAGSDLLVMGAYGHSRLREALIGGATRDILSSPPLPVLLAH